LHGKYILLKFRVDGQEQRSRLSVPEQCTGTAKDLFLWRILSNQLGKL